MEESLNQAIRAHRRRGRAVARSIGFAAVLAIAASHVEQAASQTTQFSEVGAAHGLANATVSAIVQDGQGMLWLATRNGLIRYDGYRSVAYRRHRSHSWSLPHGEVLSLALGRDGTLWVGTRGGLSRYDRARDEFVSYLTEREGTGSSGTPIASILEDSRGELWLGTDGLHRLDRATGEAVPHEITLRGDLVGAWVQALYEDRFGRIWIGTHSNGLLEMDPRSGRVRRFTHRPEDESSLPAQNVQAITEDAEGRLWVGTYGGGIAEVDRETGTLRRHRHNPGDPTSLADDRVMSMISDGVGGLWVGTEGSGLDRFDPATGIFLHNYADRADPTRLPTNSVWSLYRDAGGVLWAGTYTGGIRIAKPNNQAIRFFPSRPDSDAGLSNNRVTDFTEDPSGNIWISTDGGGLNRLDPGTGAIRHFTDWNSGVNPSALAVAADLDGAIWSGAWGGGVSRFDPRTGQLTTYTAANSNLPDENVFSLHLDRAGRLWMGTHRKGLLRLDRERGRFETYRLDPESEDQSQIWMLQGMRDGRILVATREWGFAIFDPETGTLRRYLSDPTDENTISSDEVRALVEDRRGRVWIGTASGLDRLDLATGEIVHFSDVDGLHSNSIAGLLVDDDGNVWISTDRGITRFDVAADRFRQYTMVDGLQSNEFNQRAVLRSRSGTLYFGGNNGFNAIHPERITRNERIPPIVFTGFQLFNKPVPLGESGSPLERHISVTDRIVLRHDQSVFTLEFAAMDFMAPEQNEYAYVLEGFDREWIHAGTSRSATYTNLPPGEYRFRVKAANNDGVWNEEGASLQITIMPPWWATWWFRILIGAVIVGTATWLGMSTRRRRQRLEEMNARLADAAERDRRSQRYLAGNVREMLAAMQRFSEGDHEVVLAVASDDEIGKLRQGFNAVVADRKRAEEELRQSQKMEAVGRLAGGVAHDFNNLLTVIKGNTELALDLAREPSQREELEEIERAAERASSLTRQLLAFSRKQILQPRLLSLNEVVVELGRLLRRTVGEDIELRLELDPGLGKVQADRGQVEQVLLNLVVNARDAMPQGGELRIVTRNVGANQVTRNAESGRTPHILIEVRDTGSGMEPSVLERIFEPFFTTKDQGKGTGLGLSTVYGIVSQSGGYVRVESEPEVGSCFSVYLPRVIETAEPKEITPASERVAGSETVLLAEDEDAVRLLASRVLTRSGYRVITARSGAEALELARRHEGEIDLLLTDVVMPGMSGRELAQRLLPQYPGMRLLYTSGYTEDAIVRHGVSDQETAFLPKPFAPNDIIGKVREVLDAPEPQLVGTIGGIGNGDGYLRRPIAVR